MNRKIIDALRPAGLPIQPDKYTGEEDTYIVFNYNDLGAAYGDDFPHASRYLIQVHLICPSQYNSIGIRKQIKFLLLGAGFTYSSTVNATDDDGQHYIFECEYAEGIDYGNV
jgi:hypothetical protein